MRPRYRLARTPKRYFRKEKMCVRGYESQKLNAMNSRIPGTCTSLTYCITTPLLLRSATSATFVFHLRTRRRPVQHWPTPPSPPVFSKGIDMAVSGEQATARDGSLRILSRHRRLGCFESETSRLTTTHAWPCERETLKAGKHDLSIRARAAGVANEVGGFPRRKEQDGSGTEALKQ